MVDFVVDLYELFTEILVNSLPKFSQNLARSLSDFRFFRRVLFAIYTVHNNGRLHLKTYTIFFGIQPKNRFCVISPFSSIALLASLFESLCSSSAPHLKLFFLTYVFALFFVTTEGGRG